MIRNPVFRLISPKNLGLALAVAVLVSGPATTAGRAAEEAEKAPAEAEPQATEQEGAKTEQEDANKEGKKKGSPLTARYDKGLSIESRNGKFSSLINLRGQFRLTDVSSPDLVGEQDGVEEETGFLIRRARLKMKGHAFEPWLRYKFEYGLVGNVLLTFRMDVNKVKEANVWVGQYKVPYNRARMDSSGKLQFIDRSIVTPVFTVDRQQGVTATGRLFEGKRADSTYAVGVYTGTGRGGGPEGDRKPMWVARWQWNFLKRLLPFSESALKHYPKGRGSISIAAATNTSTFTRFSSSGGGQLPGFAPTDDPGRYRVDQWTTGFAYQRRGLSSQAEYHFKRIDDNVAQVITELKGWYAQFGYFFHDIWDSFPRRLEFAVRAAAVDGIEGQISEIPDDRELTGCANWFFDGHNNKLSFDVSRLRSTIGAGSEDTGWRTRLQWDIQF